MKCYFRVETIAIRPLSAEICPPLGTLSRIECNLCGAIVVLLRKEMKKKTSKGTILLETFHEMRKEIVERNKRNTKCHRWQPSGKEIKRKKNIRAGTWEFTLWQWRWKEIWHEGQ